LYLEETTRSKRHGTWLMVLANLGHRFGAMAHEAYALAFAAIHVLCKQGPLSFAARTKRWVKLKQSCLEFDAKFGIDTAQPVDGGHLRCIGTNGSESEGYQPTPPIILTSILQQLPIAHANYTFVDLGCGKGVALLLASTFAFKRIIGVEFAYEMSRSALRNIERYRASRRDCPPIEVISKDAADFDFPQEPLVIYLFNPFGSNVLAQVIRNLRASVSLQLHDLWIVYVHPVLKRQLAECDFLDLHSEGETIAGLAARYALYRVKSCSPMPSELAA